MATGLGWLRKKQQGKKISWTWQKNFFAVGGIVVDTERVVVYPKRDTVTNPSRFFIVTCRCDRKGLLPSCHSEAVSVSLCL